MSGGATRRAFVKTAAWSVPLVAIAVAVPLAAASTTAPKYAVRCDYLGNHGHGGDVGNDWWLVTFSDGSSETLDNGTVMRNDALKSICHKK